MIGRSEVGRSSVPIHACLLAAVLFGSAGCSDRDAGGEATRPAREPVSAEDLARWRSDELYKQYVDLSPQDVELFIEHYPPYARFTTNSKLHLDKTGRVDPEKVRRAFEDSRRKETPAASRELVVIGRGPRHDAYFEAFDFTHVEFARIHHNVMANWYAIVKQEDFDALEGTEFEEVMTYLQEQIGEADSEEKAEGFQRVATAVQDGDPSQLVVDRVPVSEANLAVVRPYRETPDRLFGIGK